MHKYTHNEFESKVTSAPSEKSHGYGGYDGQTNNCVAGAVDLWDFEALAHVPPLF